ncbi:MAG: pseudaminic acid cytidylyltransferase [Sphingomicrobium sp.]
MRIAVLPARGASKRIPRKNIRSFCGRPIIAWSIDAARSTGLFDHVIVSTDDGDIANLAQELGAEVPFMRPPELADDHTGTIAVVAHATKWAKQQHWPLEAVCCIYPTAPLIYPGDLAEGLRLLTEGAHDFVLTATDYASPIFRAFRQDDDGGIEMFFPEHFESRSQDLPNAFHDAAQFYWGRPDAWLNANTLFGRRTRALVIPRWRVQDIDTPDDWVRAEALFRSLNGPGR